MVWFAACRNPRVEIEIAPEHGVPRTVVEIAKRRKVERESESRHKRDRNLAYDAVWCVFDVDDHPAILDAKQMARSNGIDLAISNPCIELWLLLHFRESPGMRTRTKVQKMLGSYVPAYNKRVDYSTYADGYATAVKARSDSTTLPRASENRGETRRRASTSLPSAFELSEFSTAGDASVLHDSSTRRTPANRVFISRALIPSIRNRFCRDVIPAIK